MPSDMSPGDPFVNVEVDERKVSQPRFLVEQEQGPLPVEHGRDYWPFYFNPQRIQFIGAEGEPGGNRDQYPANPVIAWHIWTYRDGSQSKKVQNHGATNITPRAELGQQIGRQLPPIQYPNMSTQSPTPWDDGINILPTRAADTSQEAARIALAQKYAGYSPAIVQ